MICISASFNYYSSSGTTEFHVNAVLTHSVMGGGTSSHVGECKMGRSKNSRSKGGRQAEEYIRGQSLNWFQAENEAEMQPVLSALLTSSNTHVSCGLWF